MPSGEKSDFFIYFGRLVELKGVFTLLKALKLVKTKKILYIIGEGELENQLKRYVDQNKIENVQFKGYMPTLELIPYVQKAMFTIFPSECYENYPMAIIESLACASPVVGSNLGGISGLIDHGHTGLLFEPGNHFDLAEKIQFLVDHPDLAKAMGENGRNQVESTNHPQQYYQNIMKLYQNLLNNKQGKL